MADLITGAQLAASLGVTETTAIDAIAAYANGAVIQFLGYDPTVTGTRTEYLDSFGTDTVSLQCPAPPTISAVYCEPVYPFGNYGNTPGSFGASTLLTNGVDYTLFQAEGRNWPVLLRIGALWPIAQLYPVNRLAPNLSPARGCVKVTLSYDFARITLVASQAALLEAKAFYFSPTGFGWTNSSAIDGVSVSITPWVKPAKGSNPFLSPAVASMLSQFRRFWVA